jgi:hypothetical protein
MNEIDAALANAISLEVKKDALHQRQSGDWSIRFTVAASDMDRRITEAPMGARFACVLVQVNDDETPIDHKAQDRDKWRELGAMRQAGIRCKDPIFWAYLSEELHFPPIADEDMAATCVREQCHIESRKDLEKIGNQEARRIWYMLDHGFQAWRNREHN